MNEQKTTVDWLTFRCRDNGFRAFELLLPAFGRVADLVTFDTGIEPKDGWRRAGQILCGGDIPLGRIDYEGESQRGWVRVILTGEGCAWVQDWSYVATFASVFDGGDIRRLDLCLTTYGGEVNHGMVIAAHPDAFHSGSGRPPAMRTIESSNARAGKTVYVGKRESAKMLRAYEKGFELLKDVRSSESVTHIGGDRVEDIYRVEVEFKAVDKYIPFSSVIERDAVFAGAYPFCAELVGRAAGVKMKTLPNLKPIMTMDSALENCRISYGNILRTALEAMDIDEAELLRRIISTTRSDALVRAGVLTVDHPV
jgi:phage replication initiation protein